MQIPLFGHRNLPSPQSSRFSIFPPRMFPAIIMASLLWKKRAIQYNGWQCSYFGIPPRWLACGLWSTDGTLTHPCRHQAAHGEVAERSYGHGRQCRRGSGQSLWDFHKQDHFRLWGSTLLSLYHRACCPLYCENSSRPSYNFAGRLN